MEKANDCLYCQRNDLQKELMIHFYDLTVSSVFLFREQSYYGRCVVAYKDHVKELFELSDEQRNAFMSDVCKVAKAINDTFSPEKINYGAYSDKLAHLHFHIVPKYVDGLNYGGVFEMNPRSVFLNDEEYNEITTRIINALKR